MPQSPTSGILHKPKSATTSSFSNHHPVAYFTNLNLQPLMPQAPPNGILHQPHPVTTSSCTNHHLVAYFTNLNLQPLMPQSPLNGILHQPHPVTTSSCTNHHLLAYFTNLNLQPPAHAPIINQWHTSLTSPCNHQLMPQSPPSGILHQPKPESINSCPNHHPVAYFTNLNLQASAHAPITSQWHISPTLPCNHQPCPNHYP